MRKAVFAVVSFVGRGAFSPAIAEKERTENNASISNRFIGAPENESHYPLGISTELETLAMFQPVHSIGPPAGYVEGMLR